MKNKNIIQFNKTGYLIRIIGCAFLIIITLVVYLSKDDPFLKSEDPQFYIAIILSAIIALCGLLMITWRSGITVYKNTDIIIDWWGFIFPIFKKNYKLSEFSKVSIKHEIYSLTFQPQQRKKYYVYRVYLKSDNSEIAIKHFNKKDEAIHFSKLLTTKFAFSSIEFIDEKKKNPDNFSEMF